MARAIAMKQSTKKSDKARTKRAKKEAKADLKARKRSGGSASNRTSPAVRYAESVRGGLYIVTGLSLVVALILGQRGAIMSLDDVLDNLFAAGAGKVILALIAIALLIYGLKNLRVLR